MLKASDVWLRPGDLQSVCRQVNHSNGQRNEQWTGGPRIDATCRLFLTLELSLTTLFLSGTLCKTHAQSMA